jgi:hypothetical protein
MMERPLQTLKVKRLGNNMNLLSIGDRIKSPSFGQVITATSGTVGLSWTGSTPDNSPIAGYDVYFGTTSSPALLKSGITDSFVNGVAVTPGVTYYWRVISRDNLGNTSDSGLYQFTVN